MGKPYFINGLKVTPTVTFNAVVLSISVKRRVGQLTKMFYNGKKLCRSQARNYDTYSIYVSSKPYVLLDELIYNVVRHIQVVKYINLESDKASYELLRALS